jgi:Calcineurin-like phosphoesterase
MRAVRAHLCPLPHVALGATALLLILASTAAAAAPQLQRRPYLTDLVGGAATVNFGTDRTSTRAIVRWGRSGAEPCTAHTVAAARTAITVAGTPRYQWKALLDLASDASYCYRVYLAPSRAGQREIDLLGSEPAPTFRTQVAPGSAQPFSFAVFGDWGAVGTSGTNAQQADVISRIASSGARFALTIGDNASPSGSQDNYGDLVHTGPNLSAVFGPQGWPVAGRSIALFPAIGNHGLQRSDANHPHLTNWPQDRAIAASGGRYVRETHCCLNGTTSTVLPSTWYAFTAGRARFYVLQAAWPDRLTGTSTPYGNDFAYHWAAGRAEREWLAADLAAHPQALKFAVLHYPMYSDNSTETSDTFLRGSNSLEGLLSRHGVDIAFSGHAHIYQRNLRPAGGLVTYVTGGGGDRLQPIGARGCSALDAYGIGWSNSAARGSRCGAAPVPTSVAQVHHFLLITVHADGSVTVAPTDSRGRTFDVVTYGF